jgi:pimeloyl-ACP methyl ester carboxylesterase
MSTLLLVHGAWHGASAWDRVIPLLEDRGHRTVAPTLAGLGDRASELSPETGLSEHAGDVARVLEALADEGARDVVVVGHSYGGLVAREAVDRSPMGVRRVVLVDGWAGRGGVSMFSLAPQWFTDGIRQTARDRGDGWRIPPPSPAVFGVTDAADAAWLEPRLCAQPLKSFEEQTSLTGAVDEVPGTAIICTPSNGMPFERFAESIGYQQRVIESGHDAMVIAPGELAELLAACA